MQCQVLVGEQQVHRSSLEFEKDKCASSSEQADSYSGIQAASDFTLLFSQAPSLAQNKLDNFFLNSCLEQTYQFSSCDGDQEVLWSNNDFSEFLWTRSESFCSVLPLTLPQQVRSPQLTLLTFSPCFSVWNVYHDHPTILLGSSTISIWCFQQHNHNKIIQLSAGYCLGMHTHHTRMHTASVLQRASPSAVRM